MLVPLVAALLPVALGVGLALTPLFRRGLRGPAAAFAIAVALAVVLGHLLPHAIEHVGWIALGWMVLGLLGPGLVERFAARFRGPGGAGLHVGFLALCVHQVLDGLQVGAGLTLGASGWAIAGAVGAHSVPLVGAVTLGFAQRDGARAALIRGAALVLCTGVGVVGARLGLDQVAELEWLPALIGGLLLHVLWHDLWEAPPQGARGRSIELGAFVLGAALPLTFLHLDESPFHAGLADLALMTAPVLLVGLLAGAGLRALGSSLPGRPGLVRGALSAAVVPLTACSVLPRAEALDKRGASAGAVAVFLLVAPALGLDTLLVSGALLGPQFALVRLLLAVAIPLVLALLLFGAGARGPAEPIPLVEGSLLHRFRVALSELLLHDGPWLIAGVVAAAAVAAATPGVPESPPWFWVVLLVLFAMPLFVAPTAAVPLALVLWQKGVPGWVVLAFLVLGVALNQGTVLWMRRRFGWRSVALVLGMLALPIGGAWLLEPPAVEPLRVGAFELPALSILSVLLLASAWKVGPRGWLAILSDMGGPGTGHDHGHDHGHAHEHVHEGLDPVEAAHAGELAHDHCHDHDD